MRIAIIDADLIGKGNHRFPNLACMKISSYHKAAGNSVELKTDYNNLENYDKVYISKVFIDTELPFENPDKTLKNETTVDEYYRDHPILTRSNVEYGGTGFFYDKAPPLAEEIEHAKPDYHLYDDFVKNRIDEGDSPKQFEYYTDHSIGFMTRGCIRGCSFCVNKNYKKCSKHSSVYEWIDEDRPYICCLDDNVFACKDWKEIFHELQSTGKKFQFKQGLDERLLTDEKCIELFQKSKWIGDYIFAFDNIKDKDVIVEKLKLMRKHTNKIPKFYLFCGYDHTGEQKFDMDFWVQDICDVFERIKTLMEYGCLPYIMRHNNYNTSPLRGMYVNLARWCNQPNIFKKNSYREFVERSQSLVKKECSTARYTQQLLTLCPDAERYFDMKFQDPKTQGGDTTSSTKEVNLE